MPVNLQRRRRKPRKRSGLWTHKRNSIVTRLATIIPQLQSVIVLMKIKPKFGQILCKILSTYQISTLWISFSWTTSLSTSASLATSYMQALDSQAERWWILNKGTDNRIIMRPPTRFCKQKPETRCFSTESGMQMLQNNFVPMKCL